jgi:hypothetical protein
MKILEIGNNALVPIHRIVYVEQVGNRVRLYLDQIQNGAGYVSCSFRTQAEACGAVQEILQKMKEA